MDNTGVNMCILFEVCSDSCEGYLSCFLPIKMVLHVHSEHACFSSIHIHRSCPSYSSSAIVNITITMSQPKNYVLRHDSNWGKYSFGIPTLLCKLLLTLLLESLEIQQTASLWKNLRSYV
jgi:hypothetical protein